MAANVDDDGDRGGAGRSAAEPADARPADRVRGAARRRGGARSSPRPTWPAARPAGALAAVYAPLGVPVLVVAARRRATGIDALRRLSGRPARAAGRQLRGREEQHLPGARRHRDGRRALALRPRPPDDDLGPALPDAGRLSHRQPRDRRVHPRPDAAGRACRSCSSKCASRRRAAASTTAGTSASRTAPSARPSTTGRIAPSRYESYRALARPSPCAADVIFGMLGGVPGRLRSGRSPLSGARSCRTSKPPIKWQRQTERRTLRNLDLKTRLKTLFKKAKANAGAGRVGRGSVRQGRAQRHHPPQQGRPQESPPRARDPRRRRRRRRSGRHRDRHQEARREERSRPPPTRASCWRSSCTERCGSTLCRRPSAARRGAARESARSFAPGSAPDRWRSAWRRGSRRRATRPTCPTASRWRRPERSSRRASRRRRRSRSFRNS